VIRPKTSLLAATGLLLAASLVLGACGSSAATSPATSAPTLVATTAAEPSASTAGGGGGGSAVTIADFSFSPTDLTAKVGQEVTWTNSGNVSHTVTFDTGGVDSGSLTAGSTFKHTFNAAGTFTYHCNIHSSMKATITVAP
jgi:plastocyanin